MTDFPDSSGSVSYHLLEFQSSMCHSRKDPYPPPTEEIENNPPPPPPPRCNLRLIDKRCCVYLHVNAFFTITAFLNLALN